MSEKQLIIIKKVGKFKIQHKNSIIQKMALKKEYQTTKKALLQKFNDLLKEQGGITVERMLLISKCLALPENSIVEKINEFSKNVELTEQVKNLISASNTNNPDFTSLEMANYLKSNISSFKQLDCEIGVFTFVDILSVFKEVLGDKFPKISLSIKGVDYRLSIKDDYEVVSNNLCNGLSILLLQFYNKNSNIKTVAIIK